MIGLALRLLRAHPARFLGPAVAFVMVGAVAAASGILLESAFRTNPDQDAFAHASVVVGGQQQRPSDDTGAYEGLQLPERVPVPSDVMDRLDGLRPLADVVAFHSAEGILSQGREGPGVSVELHSRSMAAVGDGTLSAGRYPTTPQEAVIPEQWAGEVGSGVGDAVTVRTRTDRLSLVVSGIAESGDPAGLSPRVTVSDALLHRLAALPRPDFVAVVAKPSTAGETLPALVRRALTGTPATVMTPDAAARAASMEVVAARQNLTDLSGTFAGLALLVGVFVAVSTIALAATQSARDIALQRAIGATPRQVRRLLGVQSVSVAVVAGAGGCVAAPWLARAALESLIDHAVIPRFVTFQYSWIPFLSGMAGVVAVAWLASALAGRKTSRIRPVDALRDSSAEPGGIGWGRVGFGVLVLAGAAFLSQLRMPGGGGTNQAATASLVVVALMVALGALGPVLASAGALLLWPVLRRAGRVGLLVASNLRRYARRTASATTGLALVVALGALTIFLPSIVESATLAVASARAQGTWRVSSDLGFTSAELQKARAVKGVEGVLGLEHTVVIHGRVSTIDFSAVRVVGDRPDTVLNLDVTSGSIPSGWDSGIMLSEQVARSWKVQTGGSVELMLAQGDVATPRVIATFERSMGFADVVMPSSMSGGEHAGVDEVVLRGDGDRATVEAVNAALGDPMLSVAETGPRDGLDENTALNLWLTRRLLALVCIMAAVSVVATLVMATTSRRREIAALGLAGATVRQIRSVIRSEGVAIWVLGAVQGFAVACVALLPVLDALPGARIGRQAMLEMLAVLVLLGLLCTATCAASLRVTMRHSRLASMVAGE